MIKDSRIDPLRGTGVFKGPASRTDCQVAGKPDPHTETPTGEDTPGNKKGKMVPHKMAKEVKNHWNTNSVNKPKRGTGDRGEPQNGRGTWNHQTGT